MSSLASRFFMILDRVFNRLSKINLRKEQSIKFQEKLSIGNYNSCLSLKFTKIQFNSKIKNAAISIKC